MRLAEPVLAVGIVALVAAAPVQAAAQAVFAIPAGPLDDALLILGRQAGISVGTIDPLLGRMRAAGVIGRMSPGRALTRLLQGLPARAERIDDATWRIVRVASPAAPAERRPASPRPTRSQAAPPAEIVVTASKRDTRLDRYPGTVYVLAGDSLRDGRARGSEAVVARLPTLASTALGPGRNKLFIRGIADSSFNGPSQATVGQYLGDVRLNYNAPDPDLSLIDVATVEILEGPQGTLYGAGALGGVIRIVPNPVLLDRTEGSLAASIVGTAHGGRGSDLSGTINLPVAADRIGVRAVGYRSVDGGYIDDVGRRLANVNRTVTVGGRAAIRVAPGDGWMVDIGGAVQTINSDDGQYAERGLPARSRASRIAQPFDNDYALASLSVAKDFGGLSFRSSAGLVAHDVGSRFDFTPPGGAATAFDQRNRIRLLSSETHLSRRRGDGAGWIVGAAILHDEERLTRNLGLVAAPERILGVGNTITNLSAYGEIGIGLLPRLVATAGLRLDYAHLTGEALGESKVDVGESRRDEVSVLPSLAMTWRPRDSATIFVRYQEGFRPGGLAISGRQGAFVIQRFRGDSLATVETGARLSDIAGSRIDASATLSYAHWENIQADLVDGSGLPFTANIGSGRIYGAEAQLSWRARPWLRAEASVFLNKSRLTDPALPALPDRDSALPNIAKLGARAAVDFDVGLTGEYRLGGGVSARYVGHSRLGVGPALAILQGGYVDTAARLRVGVRDYGLTMEAGNLLDSVGSRFALGNPFDVADRRQIVPLRPRTIRVGLDARF